MALPFLGTRTSTDQPVIDTPTLGFTSGAGFSAAITAIVAAVIAVLPSLTALDVSEPVMVALIALIGAGVLAWAIAAAGDSLARAYGLAHVTRTEPEKPNQPAIQTAAARLADAYAAAHGLKLTTTASTADGAASATTTSVYAPVSTAASKECCLEFSPPLDVRVRGKDGKAVAVLISGESGKETQRYLVGLPDSQPVWVGSDAISLPGAPPTPPAPAGAKTSITVS